jgi:hypothetical protein
MNGERKSGIGFPDAVAQVGRAMFGDEWIGELLLTEREEFLITRYVEKYLVGAVPAHTYAILGREWVEYPDNPALVAEVEHARDRMDWREHQVIAANQWLNDHNFRHAPIDSDALAREIDRCFSPVSVAPASKGGRPPAVDWTVVKTEVPRLMDENATVHAHAEPTIAAVNDLEDSVRGASTNVVARESERPPRKRPQRRRGRAREVIDGLFPEGIPDGVTDQELCAKVASAIDQRKEQKISDTTILRAAGRRKDCA